MKNSINLLKRKLVEKKSVLIIYFMFFIVLVSCNSLGEKGEWKSEYKVAFKADCKAEINKENEKSVLKLDSLTISNICDCVAAKAEKEFAPLEMEEKKSQSQMKIISTDCARDILIENLNKN
ncbi:hypothetical protein WAF17_20380 [Bernardetia sp. ABR2-2B]|uniref:hypothetical protein n=1 Tax=Bernardetia sp. ABR2-2B TaxID=3127472 RepID=UPI0030CB2E17